MGKKSKERPGPSPRADLVRAGLLALLVALIWCAAYDRWTVAAWQTPIAYLAEPEKGDVLQVFAGIKATMEGHAFPFSFMNIPELGAPYVGNWDDYPSPDRPLYWVVGFLAVFIGVFAAANFAVMAGQILSAVSFYAAGRLLGAAWLWAFTGGLIFAFSRYAFAQGQHHLTVAYYWHLPLCLVVCYWMFEEEGIRWGEKKFFFALAVAFVTAAQNIYYTNLFAQFVLIGGLVQAWRRGWPALVPAAAIIATSAATFVLLISNTLLYHLLHGAGTGALVRDYHWMEVYGLKLVDLVIPPPDHPFPPFAAWGAGHLKEIILAPGELPPTGYSGLVGLGALAFLVAISLRSVLRRTPPPLEAWLILWIVVYACVGGVNSIMGTLGFQMFRTTARYSIFILCIVLLFAVRRLSLWKGQHPVPAYAAAAALALFAIWDQTPPFVTDPDLAQTARAVASDRDFTRQVEQRLSPGAMIFQVPVMEYPESPAPGLGSYDHFRPYLYSRTLRYSFGSDKGRPHDAWQKELPQQDLKAVIHQLETYGFAGFYVNRNGFTDRAAGLLGALKDLGYTDMVQSDAGDLVCVFLKPSPHPVLPGAEAASAPAPL